MNVTRLIRKITVHPSFQTDLTRQTPKYAVSDNNIVVRVCNLLQDILKITVALAEVILFFFYYFIYFIYLICQIGFFSVQRGMSVKNMLQIKDQ